MIKDIISLTNGQHLYMESCIKMKKRSTYIYTVEENISTCKIVDFHKLVQIKPCLKSGYLLKHNLHPKTLTNIYFKL